VYKLFKKIENAKRVVADEQNIHYLATKDNRIKFLPNEEEFLKINTNIVGLVVKENCLFIESFSEIDGLEKTEVYSLTQNQFIKLPFTERIMLRGEIVNNRIICFYKEEGLKKQVGLISFLQDGKIELEKLDTDFKTFQYKLLTDSTVLSDKNGNIYIYSGNRFEKRSCFSIAGIPPYTDIHGDLQNAELASVIGIYKGLLWLHIKNWYFLALDIKTGELKHQLYMPDIFGMPIKGPWHNSFTIGDLHLDADNGVVKSLASCRYWEFDLNTFHGVVKKEFGIVTKENPQAWRINRSRYYPGDKNLYFIATRTGQMICDAIGVFDTETCEVVWSDEPLPIGKGLFFSLLPEVNKEYLTIQATEFCFWMYKRESNKG
jgi:hypothetical protein